MTFPPSSIRKQLIRHAIVAAVAFVFLAAASAAWAQLPEVARPEPGRIKPADFADNELDIPYFLFHLHELAGAVVPQGDHRGFITIPVWRKPELDQPYNARIMENCLSLAWFYSTQRPWNIYRGDAALRKRLEAALEFWCGLQSEDGRFPEYAPGEWDLAATAFATKFMGQTLLLLHNGPAVDAELLRRVAQADRKAVVAVLTRDDLYAHGRRYTNQYCGVWPGALAYLRLFPDTEIEQLLRKQLEKCHADFQSPAGYFYEHDGPDWSYNMGTSQTNLEMACLLTQDRSLLELFTAEQRLYYQWLAYNAVVEPDGSGFVLNRAVETRQRIAFVAREPAHLFSHVNPPGQSVELARPFCTSREELGQRRRAARADLQQHWPTVAPLRSFTPYDFFARSYSRWLPSNEERRQATAKLPYLARDRFTHQRTDSRFPAVYTFVRRPQYYAAFNSGRVLVKQQRFGLGLIWHPQMGAVLQSQTGTREAAWGTQPSDAENVSEAATFQPVLKIDGRQIEPKPGAFDLPDGELTIEYPLGTKGRKTVVFADDGIRVSVQCPGRFTENIPLLAANKETPLRKTGELQLGRVRVTFDPAAKSRVTKPGIVTGSKSVQVLHLDASDVLTYTLGFGA